ncbi:MAG: hypothetical protein WCR56_06830 [Bacilli bacterium]
MENTKTVKPVKNKKFITSKQLSVVFIILMCLCIALLVTMVILTSIQYSENQRLKAEEDAIIQEYTDLETKNGNLSDEDYASVYFGDGTIYIPYQDVIIDYHG